MNTTAEYASLSHRMVRLESLLVACAIFVCMFIVLSLISLAFLNDFTPRQVWAWLCNKLPCSNPPAFHEFVLDENDGALIETSASQTSYMDTDMSLPQSVESDDSDEDAL